MKQAVILFLVGWFVCVSATQGQTATGKSEPVRNIILMIGDGMGVAQVCAAITVNHGQLNMAEFPVTGFSKTSSATDYITDSGAGATAIAIGEKTYNHAIGMDADTMAKPTILEIASHHGKSTGLVVTSQVTHATPAAFVAHQPDRYMYEQIASDFLNSDIDLFIGGGLDHFTKREDNNDLTAFLASDGYQLVYKMKDLEKIKSGKVAGLLYDDKPPRYSKGRKDMLPEATKKAIEILSQNKSGFFLLVEGSQIDWACHKNNDKYMIEETFDFDEAVKIARQFAEKDGHTLVIVTADHETGGLTLPEGDLKSGDVKAKFSSLSHTGIMVPVFAFGPGSSQFTGVYENTELFFKMMKAFGFPLEQ
ncbi:MAG: alkaline phosphatase [Bacteroidales bacterium]|nr:alkaline phosphatase [Bacteroidales bacterium]